MANHDLHHLPRLEEKCYRAFAAVHWTMRVQPSTAGWLGDRFHREFRELLVHACARERLFCPVYCLMPDHLHLMWLGLSLDSHQLNGMRFLRGHLNRLLAGEPLQPRKSAALSPAQPRDQWRLQPQAHDHVLREEERRQNAFAKVCFYILENPGRAGLGQRGAEWPFSGTIAPGYPDLDPFQDDFWELFWRLYYRHRESTPAEPLKEE